MNYAIILAGGTGTRAGGTLPKQFQNVRGMRMLWWSVLAFRQFDPECRIVLVVHPDFLDKWDMMFGEEEKKLSIYIDKVAGGKSRIESVRNGLEYLAKNINREVDDTRLVSSDDVVFIHDSARPFVTPELISRGAGKVRKGVGTIPVIPLTDSIRRKTPQGTQSADRSEFVTVQTPQIFIFEDIYNAYNSLREENGFTDDASVAERNGLVIATVEGEPSNFKITTAYDLQNIS